MCNKPSEARMRITQLLVWFLLTITVAAQTTTGPIPSTLFGITSVSSNNYPTVPFGVLGKGAQVSMSYIEQVKGTRVWTTLDAYVALANSHGQPFHWAMDEAPPWAASTCHVAIVGIQKCSGDVTDVAGLDAFYTALTTRYNGSSGHGHIDVFELYNEPETAFTGSVANLVTQTNHLATAVRANAPAAKVAGLQTTYPDTYYTTGNLLDTYWAAGGTKSLDAVGFHGYPHHGTDVPEILNTFVPVIKSALSRNGMSSTMPIYQTEGSWGDITETGWMVTDPNQQAAWVARTYLLAWSNGVSRYIWYSWDAYPWGALWISGTVQQAGAAYTQIYNWMVGARMTAACTLSSSLWSCPLTLANGHQALAVWNNVLSTATVSYTPASQYTAYHTLAGNTVSVTGAIFVGQQPLLFEASTTATGGKTYFYVVTAVNSAGESGPSNQVTVTIPIP